MVRKDTSRSRVVLPLIGIGVGIAGVVVSILLARSYMRSPSIERVHLKRMEHAATPFDVRLGQTEITVVTSEKVYEVPTPLIFVDSGNQRHEITLDGRVPGREFSGSFVARKTMHEGEGSFFFEKHALCGKLWRSNTQRARAREIVTIDKTPPELLSIRPERSAYKNGDRVKITIESNEPLHRFKSDFSNIDSEGREPVESFTPETKSRYSVLHIISSNNAISQGTYPIHITAFDKAGNSVSKSIGLFLKYPIEIVDIHPSNDGKYKNGDRVALTVQLQNVREDCSLKADFSRIDDRFHLRENQERVYEWGQGWYTISYQISEHNTVDDSGSPFEVPVIARDEAGNEAMRSITVTLDNNPPQFISVRFGSEAKEAYRRQDTIPIVVTLDEEDCTLEADLSEVDSMYTPERVSIYPQGRIYQIRYKVSPENTRRNGVYNIRLRATDDVGNRSNYNEDILVHLRNFAPRFIRATASNRIKHRRGDEVILTCYLDCVDALVSVNFQNIDRNYDPQRVSVVNWSNDEADNDGDDLIDENDEQGVYSLKYTLSENVVPDGSYVLVVTASDIARNEATDTDVGSATIELDSTLPDRICIIGPTSWSHIGKGEVIFTVNDEGRMDEDVHNFVIQCKTSEMESYVDVPEQVPGEWTPGGISTVKWNSEILREGVYSFQVRVIDDVGNQFISPAVQNITVDKTPPDPPWLVARSDDKVVVVWIPAGSEDDISRYNIYRCTFEGEWIPRVWPQGTYDSPITSVATKDPRYYKKLYYEWVDTTDLVPGRTYCYVLTATDLANNESKQSNEDCITFRKVDTGL